MEMILNTVRKIDHDQIKEFLFGDERSLQENLAIAFLNPKDYNSLNLDSSSHIKIISKFGSVILKPIGQDKVPQTTIYVPISIWANQITGIMENEVIYKNIKVNVEKTEESIKSLKEIIKNINNSRS